MYILWSVFQPWQFFINKIHEQYFKETRFFSYKSLLQFYDLCQKILYFCNFYFHDFTYMFWYKNQVYPLTILQHELHSSENRQTSFKKHKGINFIYWQFSCSLVFYDIILIWEIFYCIWKHCLVHLLIHKIEMPSLV